jgi:glucan phosphorylase
MWKDGYWQGEMKDGYPSSYFDENDNFSYPWERNEEKGKKIEKDVDNEGASC